MITPALRCVYCDLDGTLLGLQGSLFHDRQGRPTLSGAMAISQCHRAGVEFVIFSGRRGRTVFDLTRLIGSSSYIFEAGCGLIIDGEPEWLFEDFDGASDVSVHDQIAATGAPDLLLSHYSGRLEHHAPWHRDREISHLFRGLVDTDEVSEFLATNDHSSLRLVDNGIVGRKSESMTFEGLAHAYHLVPAGASKRRAVERHMEMRGYKREECIAVGDSCEDLAAATAVGTFWTVANADIDGKTSIEGTTVRRCDNEVNKGVLEAVTCELEERQQLS